MSDAPIIVLDSGLGGLTVVRALRRVLPQEDIIYFGDTARVPYGSKSKTTVTTFVRQIIDYLRPFEAKHVVIACNTATALAMPTLRYEYADLSLSGVIEPGAKAAAAAAGTNRTPIIGVIATEATIRSRAYELAIVRRRSHARLACKATPLLVPLIEEGRQLDDPLIHLALTQYLQPMLDLAIDVLLLGCTHYPLLMGPIVDVVGHDIAVIDSGQQCAEDVQRRLAAARLLRGSDGGGSLRCFVTDDSPRFATQAARFLGLTLDAPTVVTPDELYAHVVPTIQA